ncbi:MAG: hypothetical protein QM820_64815 [Minicystis sp.]
MITSSAGLESGGAPAATDTHDPIASAANHATRQRDVGDKRGNTPRMLVGRRAHGYIGSSFEQAIFAGAGHASSARRGLVGAITPAHDTTPASSITRRVEPA